jgi:hypothetical protein
MIEYTSNTMENTIKNKYLSYPHAIITLLLKILND